MHETRVEAGAILILEDYAANEVEISNLQITETGMGLGSKIILNLIYLADWYGINLMVIPAGVGMRRDMLVGFWSRFGFQEDGDLMRYKARPGGQNWLG